MSSTLAAAIYSWAKPSQHSAHTICLPDPPIVISSSPSTWKKHSFKNTVWKIQFGKYSLEKHSLKYIVWKNTIWKNTVWKNPNVKAFGHSFQKIYHVP